MWASFVFHVLLNFWRRSPAIHPWTPEQLRRSDGRVETEPVVHYESQHQSNKKVQRRREIYFIQLGYEKAIATYLGAQGTFKGVIPLVIAVSSVE